MKKFALLLAMALGASGVYAQEAYKVLNDGVLTFYYDEEKENRAGEVFGFNFSVNDPQTIRKVVFDSSISNFQPEGINLNSLFRNYSELTEIEGINYLNTSNVTDMGDMFRDCSSLESLDLSNFDTSSVIDMVCMFNGCSSLTSLDVSNFNTSNVTDMSGMFLGCSSLTSLDLSNFNTSNATDMRHMFYECSSLTSLDLSNFNTSNVKYMYYMFGGCNSLTSLDLSNFNTSNVKYMSFMFGGCSSLTSLDVSNFNTSNVTDMFRMFDGCSSLTSLDLSSFNKSNVTNMGRMFCECSSLESLDLSNFDTNCVTDMSFMFSGCSCLKSINLSGLNTSQVTNMGWMFNGCSSLESLDLSNFDTSSVIDMVCMFNGCSSLTSLDLSHFNTSNTTQMDRMFGNCENLKSIDVSSFNTEKVFAMGYMFSGCSGIQSIDVSNFCTNENTNTDGMFGPIKHVIIGEKFTKISKNTFGDIVTLTTLSQTPFAVDSDTFTELIGKNGCLIVPKGSKVLYQSAEIWKEIPLIYEIGDIIKIPYAVLNGNTLNFAFDDGFDRAEGEVYFFYNSIVKKSGGIIFEEVHGKEWDKNNITKAVFSPSFSDFKPMQIHRWFSGCRNLTEIEGLEYLNTSCVTEMFSMFANCSSLENIDVSHFDTGNVTDMRNMFKNCSSLENIDVSHFDTKNVTNMQQMFLSCSKIKNIDVSGFDTKNVTDMTAMFERCSSIEAVDVSNFVTDKVTSMGAMFADCHNLKSIDVRNFDTSNLTDAIHGQTYVMFGRCYSLKEIVLGDKFTRISNQTFQQCSSLESVTIGKNVKSIGDYAFNACRNIKTINSHIEQPFAFATNAFDSPIYKNATLNVPANTKSLYLSTDGWKEFKNIAEFSGGNSNQDLEPVDEGDNTDYGNGDVDENTDLNGNVVGNIYYNITDNNGEYSSTEGCIILRKPTSDTDMNNLEGQDIFGEDFKNGFTGIVFMVQGSGTVKVNAETVGNMTLKVKFGNNAPVTMELEGKMKASFPYSVSEPTYVYIYGGETQTANAKGLRAASSNNALKIYGIEWSDEYETTTNLESILDNVNTNAIIYNLQGQRMKAVTKGINIINGKKVIIK